MKAKMNVDKCEEKLSSIIDVEHIRNMFFAYYSSTDPAIKANTLKVLFKALEVSEDE